MHAAGGLFVLDCIASGTVWVDMQASGDVLAGDVADGIEALGAGPAPLVGDDVSLLDRDADLLEAVDSIFS